MKIANWRETSSSNSWSLPCVFTLYLVNNNTNIIEIKVATVVSTFPFALRFLLASSIFSFLSEIAAGDFFIWSPLLKIPYFCFAVFDFCMTFTELNLSSLSFFWGFSALFILMSEPVPFFTASEPWRLPVKVIRFSLGDLQLWTLVQPKSGVKHYHIIIIIIYQKKYHIIYNRV